MKKNCVFEMPAPGTYRCVRCAAAVKSRSGRVFHPSRVFRRCNIQRGLGDLVALGLERIGITKDRAARWRLRLKHWPELPAVYLHYDQPATCGCGRREAVLDRFGWRIQVKLNRLGWFIRHRWAWLRGLFR